MPCHVHVCVEHDTSIPSDARLLCPNSRLYGLRPRVTSVLIGLSTDCVGENLGMQILSNITLCEVWAVPMPLSVVVRIRFGLQFFGNEF